MCNFDCFSCTSMISSTLFLLNSLVLTPTYILHAYKESNSNDANTALGWASTWWHWLALTLASTSTLQDKLYSAYRRILRYALGVHFPDCISNAELTRRTGATALSKTLRPRRLRLVGHALRMANPSPLTILLCFLQPGLRRRRGQA